jgi:hypothetical protein
MLAMNHMLSHRTPNCAPLRRLPARRTRTRLLVELLEDRLCLDTVTLNFVDSGWWDSTGFRDINFGGQNYIVGQYAGLEYRDFFVFNLSGITDPIIGAQLRVFEPSGGRSSPDPTDTYSLFDVSTPIPTLRGSGTGQVQIFNDLGTGVDLGSHVVSNSDNGQVVPIDFNDDGLSYLNAARGGQVALGGAITTIVGSGDRYIFGGTGDPSNTRQLVLDIQPAGASVVASTPSGGTFGIVNSVRVTFNEEIDASTFTRDQIVSFTRTDGSGVTDLLPTVLGVTPVTGSGNRQFDIAFVSQFALGNYALTIGPDILDLLHHPMDQNHNGIPGEVPDDEFTATFTIQGPRIVSSTPAGDLLAPVGSVRVTFNEPVNPNTFTASQVASFSGPGGPLAVSGIFPVTGSNNTQFVLTFAPQTAAGSYTMQIGPDIQDLYGHRMDQNQNFIEGENPGDLYTASFAIESPHVLSSTPSGVLENPVGSMRVTFNESINAASFTTTQLTFTGPAGPIDVSYVAVVPGTAGTQFDIVFPTQTALGQYSMQIGPGIQDVYGNPADVYAAQFAIALNLLRNGGFEEGGGSFAGWTHVNLSGSFGDWYIQSGTVSPVSGFLVPAPPGPTHAAMTDTTGPGSHVLYQDFVVPGDIQTASLSFDRYIGNQAGIFVTPNTLDYSGAANQQARVDIITTTANPFSVAPADVLMNVYQTHVGDPPISGYTTQTTDLSALLAAHPGETLRLRFAEADNQSYFQFGVDQVALDLASGGPRPHGGGAAGRLSLAPPVISFAGALPLGQSPLGTAATLPYLQYSAIASVISTSLGATAPVALWSAPDTRTIDAVFTSLQEREHTAPLLQAQGLVSMPAGLGQDAVGAGLLG